MMCVIVAVVWTAPFLFCFFSVGVPLFCMHRYVWTATFIVAGCLTQNCLLWTTCFARSVIHLILMCIALRVGRCRMYGHSFLFVLPFCFPGTSLLCNFIVIVVIPPWLMILSGLRDEYPYVYIMTRPNNFHHWIMYPLTFAAVTWSSMWSAMPACSWHMLHVRLWPPSLLFSLCLFVAWAHVTCSIIGLPLNRPFDWLIVVHVLLDLKWCLCGFDLPLGWRRDLCTIVHQNIVLLN
jgi:hypothetical protein